MYTLEEIYQKLEATQQQVADLEARLNADGKHVTSGDMVLIPAGSFVMGATTNVGHESSSDERPQHTVTVSAFFMDKYEVTSNLWAEVYTWATNKGYSFGTGWRGKAANHPVRSVDWYDAIAWCNARSQRDGFTPCYTNANGTVYTNAAANSFAGGCNWTANGYRLPTEAEWEKAARGGVANRRFPWDDANTIQHARANYYAAPASYTYDTSLTTGYHPSYNTGGTPYTSPVGSFAPNGYGLYDMAGNVWEWCWDWYSNTYYASSPGTDPTGPTGPLTSRVLRGGSWTFLADYARVANRLYSYPDDEDFSFGFRCARGL
jgi:formylglycine-generating enzyme required for sulfatase activity